MSIAFYVVLVLQILFGFILVKIPLTPFIILSNASLFIIGAILAYVRHKRKFMYIHLAVFIASLLFVVLMAMGRAAMGPF